MLRPGTMAEHEPVAIRISDSDSPPVPEGVAGDDPLAAGTHETVDSLLVDRSTEVEDEQILLARSRRRLAIGVINQL